MNSTHSFMRILPANRRRPPGEKHWHGASPDVAMTHIAILEALDGKTVDWMEHVSDEHYKAAASRAE